MLSIKRSLRLVPCGAIALVAGCVWQSDYDALQGRYDTLAVQSQQLQAQNQQLQGQNQQLHGEVARLQSAIKYTLNSDLLFAPGSWKMSASGQQVIAKLASQLAPTQQRRIVVNGYTDNAPIGESLQRAGVTSNEILSQKRAEAVMEYLISRGVKPDLVAAKGWGEQEPVAQNDTAAGRAQNRRVEITLAPQG
jgi:chemotaxis protein MotB